MQGVALWLRVVFVLSLSLPFFSPDSQAQIVNICDRTIQVQRKILDAAFWNNCATVTANDLAYVKKLVLISEGISSLKVGDFSGLPNLEWLFLSYNPLGNVPEKLFEGLTSLRRLALYNTSLTSLPDSLFNGLTSLEWLALGANSLDSLHEDLFDGLSRLRELSLNDNSLDSLHEDLFDGLTSLKSLSLNVNELTSLPENLFDHVASPQQLDVYLHHNGIPCFPAAIVKNKAVRLNHLNANKICGVFATSLLLSPASISENGGNTTVTATLDQVPSAEVKIAVSTVPKVSPDFALSLNDTLTVAAGQMTSTGTVTITANDNDVAAPDKTVTIQGTVTSTETVIGPADVTLTITDDDVTPTVTLVLSPASVSENGGSTTVTATLDQPSREVTTVTISAIPQTPAILADYVPSPNPTLTIAAGQLTSTGVVTITANDNAVDAPDKMITIQGSVSNIAGVTGPADVTLTISDDDAMPTVTLVVTSASIRESGESTTITATLDHPSSVATTVSVSAVPQAPALTADFVLSANTPLTIAAGQTTSTGDMTITTVDNDVDAPDKTVTIQGMAANPQGITGPADVTLTITDDDIASVAAPVSVAVTEGRSKNLRVALSSQPTADVTVTVTGYAATDLTPTPTALTFTPTTWSTSQSMRLTAAEDGDVMNDLVTLTLTASGGYARVPHSVVVTITDNDVASVTAPMSAVVPEGGSRDLSMSLSSPPTVEVTLTITGYTATDLTPTPLVLTFTPTDWATAKTVTLTAAEDGDVMNDQVALTLMASGGSYTGVTHSVAVTITDNDVASVMAPTSAVVPEGGMTDLSVALSAQPTAEVTLTITGHVATDLMPAPTTLIFTPANWATAQTVTLAAAEDGDFTQDEVMLTLTASGGGYANVTHPVAVTITDNDVAAVTAPASVVLPEGRSTNLSVSLSSSPTVDVTLTFQGHAGTDLTPTPPVLVFTPADWSVPQTVILTAIEDGDFTDDQIALTLTATGGGYTGVTHSVAVTITDNDVAAVTAPASVVIPEGGTTNLPVALLSPPTGDVTLTIVGFVGTDLWPPPSPLTFTTINWNVTQTVTLSAAEDGDFTDDQVTLTLTASGGGYTGVTHTVAVTITDNDVAAVTAPASVVVSEGSSSDLSVALSAQPTAEVTLTVSGHAGTDLTPTPPVLVFTSTDWATTQILTLAASEDGDFTDDQVALMLTASGGGYTGVTHSVAVTITDNDEAAVAAPASVVVSEGSSSDLSVALSAQPTAEVTLTVSGHAGTDLTPTPQTLTFTTTSWSTSQTVTLTAGEDEDFTDDQVVLTLTASGGGYAGVTHSVAVTITDNDTEAPLALSIHDLQILEDAARAWLRVELNRPSNQVVTVQYATSDRTAERGSDYTASRGIVVFDRNTTKGVIPVGIVDDELPEEQEQLAVTLSKPRNAVIARGAGTLTIVDNDGGVTLRIEDEVVEENAEVIRFTVYLSHPSSESVSVAYRTEDGTAKAGKDYRASTGTVAFAPGMVTTTIAVPLLREDLDWREETFSVHLERSTHARIEKAVAVATIRNTDSVARDMLAAYTARFVRTSSMQIVEALQERVRSHADGSACGAGARAELARLWHAPTDWTPSLGELLAGCRISEKMEASGGAVRAWGRGAFRRFNGQGEGALTLHGEVTTGIVGIDYGWNGRWVAGVLLTHSRGEGTFSVRDDSGEMQSRLTGIYPYVAYQSGTGGMWGIGGYGRGQVEVSELEGGLGAGFGALGFWGRLRSGHSMGVTYYGDGIYADAVVTRQDVQAEVYRLRLGLEADLRIREEVRPYVKANVRQDGGSAETGLGLELGAGVRVAVPAWRLRADVQTQGLVVHTVDGFTEWGVSGSVQVGSGTEGLMLRVRPSWGLNQGMPLFHQQTVLDAIPTGGSLRRTEMELGYGVPVRQGTARSILGMTRLSRGVMYRLGGELHPRDRFTLSVFGLAHAHGATPGKLGLNVRGLLQY